MPDDSRLFTGNSLLHPSPHDGSNSSKHSVWIEFGCDLSGVRFALLALGDSRYARFCGGGEAVRAALLKSGAIETTSPASSSTAGAAQDGNRRGGRATRWQMLEPYAGQLARTVLRGPGRSQNFPGHPTPESNTLRFVEN